jgi:hypothetical protein
MGEASERIERHIAHERQRLGNNLARLEQKINIEKDRFQNTAVVVGSIVGGGVLIGLLVGRLTR